MRRSQALVALSHDHHQALAVALRLRRATDEDLADALSGFRAFWCAEGEAHFAREERVLLPALPADADCAAAAARTRAEHAAIRRLAGALEDGDAGRLLPIAHELGAALTAHVRFEERELFALAEERLAPDALIRVGAALAS